MTTRLELYTPISALFNGNFFDSFEEMFSFLDRKAQSNNIKIDLTLEDFIEFKKNPTKHTVLTEMYFTFKHGYKELIDIYGLHFPYVLSKLFEKTVNQISSELSLTNNQKNTLIEVVTNYAADTWLEEALQRAHERSQKDQKFSQDFKNEFEADLSQLIQKYKKRYPTILTTTFLDLLESKIIQGPVTDVINRYNDPKDQEVYSSAIEALSAFQRKRGRPKSQRYDEFLASLKTALIDSESGIYMPKLVHTLQSLASSDETLFKGFEINENSLRSKLSKSKN